MYIHTYIHTCMYVCIHTWEKPFAQVDLCVFKLFAWDLIRGQRRSSSINIRTYLCIIYTYIYIHTYIHRWPFPERLKKNESPGDAHGSDAHASDALASIQSSRCLVSCCTRVCVLILCQPF